jgi:hypothetical protein
MNQLPISSLHEGSVIDLESIIDHLNDPDVTDDYNPYEFEYAYVEAVERETDDCVRIDTNQGTFGLPPDLLVVVIR